jgi:hypothetical protein
MSEFADREKDGIMINKRGVKTLFLASSRRNYILLKGCCITQQPLF